ncbi:hypothetical protein FGO68_gene7212 [Halteria grandinella]|uniref:Secreted protein n=1 Tax=Halteria grandinella TaxID=5974 RepID=A0A8J8NIN6_HALGN|nr:hypothetical protein FGO68_gene7212 [Halteria grandinella]
MDIPSTRGSPSTDAVPLWYLFFLFCFFTRSPGIRDSPSGSIIPRVIPESPGIVDCIENDQPRHDDVCPLLVLCIVQGILVKLHCVFLKAHLEV